MFDKIKEFFKPEIKMKYLTVALVDGEIKILSKIEYPYVWLVSDKNSRKKNKIPFIISNQEYEEHKKTRKYWILKQLPLSEMFISCDAEMLLSKFEQFKLRLKHKKAIPQKLFFVSRPGTGLKSNYNCELIVSTQNSRKKGMRPVQVTIDHYLEYKSRDDMKIIETWPLKNPKLTSGDEGENHGYI